MTKNIKSDSRVIYKARINRVIDYVNTHLDGDLSLRILARIACFSPFHFHRIFHAFMGETLSQFIQRVRLEKAAAILLERPADTVTEIALACGFSGPATLGRAFREAFGMNAGQWRAGGHKQHRNMRTRNSNLDQSLSKTGKDTRLSSMYIDPDTNLNYS